MTDNYELQIYTLTDRRGRPLEIRKKKKEKKSVSLRSSHYYLKTFKQKHYASNTLKEL